MPSRARDVLNEYKQDGYAVARALFTADEVDELRAEFTAQAARGPVQGLSDLNPNWRPDDPLSRWPRLMHPHRFPHLPVGPLALSRMLDPRVRTILELLFGEPPLAAQSMFYFKPPGARGQDLHQDNFYLRVRPGTCIAAWTAVDDCDEENGALMVVPGTRDLPVQCPERADPDLFFTSEHVAPPTGSAPVAVRMRAGDTLFFGGSVIHGSWPNTSRDRFRRAFICHYVPASSAEVSSGYRPLLTFEGREVPVAGATGGGPCGTLQDVASPH